jgi:hypothetical protein
MKDRERQRDSGGSGILHQLAVEVVYDHERSDEEPDRDTQNESTTHNTVYHTQCKSTTHNTGGVAK